MLRLKKKFIKNIGVTVLKLKSDYYAVSDVMITITTFRLLYLMKIRVILFDSISLKLPA